MMKTNTKNRQNSILASKLFPATQRKPADEESVSSHQLLVRAGYIRQVAAGIFTLCPLAMRVLARIENIVREEMVDIGGLEVNLPIIQPTDLWKQTNRYGRYMSDGNMFNGKDRRGQEYCLAPTAEEVVTLLAATDLKTYAELPLTLWQMDWKFRDELRPRMGLVRSRMFRMKDSYSFDVDEDGMRQSYELHRQAYTNMFTRMGFKFISVQADSGAIGGKGSAEFMAVCDVGEDILLTCNNCDYGANVEKAESVIVPHEYSSKLNKLHKEATPATRTVEELEKFFKLSARQMMKTIIYVVDGATVAVCCRGDLPINEVKLANLLGAVKLEIASDAVVIEVTGAPVGFAGPINLTQVDRIVYDTSVEPMTNFLCGCNEADVHMLDVNWDRDISMPPRFADVHKAQAGDQCKQCQTGTLEQSKGIEVGHIFMLQQEYAEMMGATFTGIDSKAHTPFMGCYGVGTTRCIPALVEQYHDEKGIIWPEAVAPYRYVIVPSTFEEGSAQRKLAERIYEHYSAEGEEIVLDDRNMSFGAKMKDAELIGYPYIVVVGRGAENEEVELQQRSTNTSKVVPYFELTYGYE